MSSVRRSISAAESLPAAVVHEWYDRTRIELLDGIGTTELAHVFISSKSGSIRPGSIGQVVAGYEARVVDADCQDVPDGVPGLLAVRGPTGARYWRDPEAQCSAVRNGWTLTGDICRRDEHGWFTHLHRNDDLIVSGGYKVSPAEVERALLDHADVCEARVFPVADPTRGAVPHAEICLAPAADRSGASDRLQQYLRQELAPYKCPRMMRVLA
jgi:2-aminobenzoate-CoA ligase